MHPPAACLTLLLIACAWPSPSFAAQAQSVQRCVGADGRAVYTDQRCEAVGAAARIAPATGAEGARMFSGGCPRVLSQLVGEIAIAIRGGDPNRLASLYDWSGVSNASASRVLDRLEAIVARPLVDIAPVYPGGATPDATASPSLASPMPPLPEPTPSADTQAQAGGPASWMPSWNARPAENRGEPMEDSAPYPVGATSAPVPATGPTPPRPRPIALRIEQTLAGGATPASTVFGLRRSYGCFWIAL